MHNPQPRWNTSQWKKKKNNPDGKATPLTREGLGKPGIPNGTSSSKHPQNLNIGSSSPPQQPHPCCTSSEPDIPSIISQETPNPPLPTHVVTCQCKARAAHHRNHKSMWFIPLCNLEFGNPFLQPRHSGFFPSSSPKGLLHSLVFLVLTVFSSSRIPGNALPLGWGWSWTRLPSRRDASQGPASLCCWKRTLQGQGRAKNASTRCCCGTNMRDSVLLFFPWHRYLPLEPGFRHGINEDEGKCKIKPIFAQRPASHRENSAARPSVFLKLAFNFTKHQLFSRTRQQDQPGPARAAQAGKRFIPGRINPAHSNLCRAIPMEAAGWALLGSPWGVPSLLVPRPSWPGSPHPAPPSAELTGTPRSPR